jgi:hypothetical protein
MLDNNSDLTEENKINIRKEILNSELDNISKSIVLLNQENSAKRFKILKSLIKV